jgi:hypothetical protein
MDVTLRIEKNIVGFEITMNDALRVDISQCAAEFCHPKPYSFFGKAFSRDVETQITAIHKIDNDVTSGH